MPKFIKKPVVISAQLNVSVDGNTASYEKWFIEALTTGKITAAAYGSLAIKTMEGTMTAAVGDWVIQGIKGELYPCKPDIFEATYDSVVSLELTEVEKGSGIAEGVVTFETGNKVLLHSVVGEPEILQTSGE